jgi:hypothetical protein
MEVVIPRFDIALKPWKNWIIVQTRQRKGKSKKEKRLKWWNAYNEVKHYRHESYRQANLQNLLNAFGALYSLQLLYYNLLIKKKVETPIDAKHFLFMNVALVQFLNPRANFFVGQGELGAREFAQDPIGILGRR